MNAPRLCLAVILGAPAASPPGTNVMSATAAGDSGGGGGFKVATVLVALLPVSCFVLLGLAGAVCLIRHLSARSVDASARGEAPQFISALAPPTKPLVMVEGPNNALCCGMELPVSTNHRSGR
ncbi:hypothetical protein WJX81_007232 [Elliptochloris bilobata]|uniref:Uncharacterized protein n=1 Tax=Elliptochloris bilobata TaxID=381761 RepID=A0AAW1QXV4_9CHLO